MNNYEKVMKRFGLTANLPEPEFEPNPVELSEAERQFLLSEKKWNVDHANLQSEEAVEEGEAGEVEDENV